MPFLNNIVDSINALIKDALKIPSIKMYGISEVMVEAGKDESGKDITIKYPSTINSDAEVEKIIIDDAYSVFLYHKIESVVNSVDAKSGFGTSRGNLTEAANMSLLIFAFRKQTRKDAWRFEAVIKDMLPEVLNITDKDAKPLQRSLLKVGNSNYDKLFLLQREFTEIELNYPDLMAMELKYRIESSWRKGCFIKCGCSNPSATNYIVTEQGSHITTQAGSPLIIEN
jgi:hypothetical protein